MWSTRPRPASSGPLSEQVKECHAKGQPVLVGTISIEKSEILSKMLKREGIPHNVLNAKYHEMEAQIVAQAGKLGRCDHCHQHGRTWYRHHAGRQRGVPGQGGPAQAGISPRSSLPRRTPSPRPQTPKFSPFGRNINDASEAIQGPILRKRPRRSVLPAACSSSAPSAMSPAGSTISCGAVPAVRATPARAGST